MALENPCAGIAEVIERCETRAKDSFWVFAKIHFCICSRVTDWAPPPLAELNAQFVQKLVDVHESFVRGDLEQLPREWQQAIAFYVEHPKNYAVVLFRMAYAHILRDLRRVLVDLHSDVPENDYDEVYEDIVFCLDEIGSPYTGNNILDKTIGSIYGSAGPLRNLTVRKLRTYVYKRAQRDRAEREERIRQRAYEISRSRGGDAGHDWEDWFQAEKEIRAAED